MIGDYLEVDLVSARAETESRMTETLTIGAETFATDQVTGDAVRSVADPVYSDIGQIVFPSTVVSERDTQGQHVATTSPMLKLPTSVGGVVKGHVVRVTASSSDSTLVGRWFRVKSLPQSGQVTAHRYPLEEVT